VAQNAGEEMDIIYCAGGGRILAEIAQEEGFMYGSRSDDVRTDPRCNGIIDINWRNYQWQSHLAAVQAHQPRYAVATDIVNRASFAVVMKLATELERCCERVIIVPKQKGLVSKIPRKYVIGISIPTSYSGFIPQCEELSGRDVHLLGGSPKQQQHYWKQYQGLDINVTSLDINCHNKVSSFGKYWDGSKWVHEGIHVIDKYEAFRKSCQGIMAMWKALGAI
jgi:hypothetical protein